MPADRSVRIPPSDLLAATSRVFGALGLPEAAAVAVAEGLVDADMRGIPSHGLMLVPMYAERIQAGSVTTATEAETVADLGAIAVLDAADALGILTADQAMGLAVERARQFGIGAVAVRHAFHFGGAFRYVMAAAEAGMIGIAAANTRPLMPPPGGAATVVGNNPLAIGVPSAGGEPIVLDMALSEAALGKIRLAAAEGRAIPPTWATDAAGIPTTDPEAAIAGLLLPAAGPKGYGLAFMLDVLTGVLSGGAFGAGVQGLYSDTSVANDCAHFFLAIDPAAFGGADAFAARVEELAAQVTSSPTAPGVERVLLPGQLEAERHAAARAGGVRVERSVIDKLREVAASLGVDLEQDLGPADREEEDG
ncbi:MAG TPA: Ldh family oxidoreductase [Solirubrobacterales bacterium]|jgi:LDH2 family malate/lactate/ureidoglycolate dehydrogenase